MKLVDSKVFDLVKANSIKLPRAVDKIVNQKATLFDYDSSNKNWLYKFHRAKAEKLKLLSLKNKEAFAKYCIKKYYEKNNGNVYVCFSGGKDSTLLKHLIGSIYPNVKNVFVNTTNEYKELVSFVKSFKDIEILTPKMSMPKVFKTYGFPLVSKSVCRAIKDLKNPTEKNLKTREGYLGKYKGSLKLAKKWHKLIDAPFNISNKCCDILKKNPLREFEKRTKLKPIVGTTIFESQLRLNSIFQNFSIDKLISKPLSLFNEQEIWKLIKKYKLDYCKLYDKGEKKLGCKACGMGLHLDKDFDRFENFKKESPKLYNQIFKKIVILLSIKQSNL